MKIARINAFLTQVKLAELAGTTGTTVYRLETGRQNASLGMLKRLGDALGIDPTSLFVSPPS